MTAANVPKSTQSIVPAASGCFGSLVGGIAYAVIILRYLGYRAWDQDIGFFVQGTIGGALGLVLGGISGGIVASVVGFFAERNFRIHLITVIACSIALGAFLTLNFNSSIGNVHQNGTPTIYGWPFPAVATNFLEVIERELTGKSETLYSWTVFGPFLFFDAAFALCAICGIAYWSERRIQKVAPK